MDIDEISCWRKLLRQPDFSAQMSRENLYRAAAIGAISLLFEAGDITGLGDTIRYSSSPEIRKRSLLALQNLVKMSEPIRSQAVHQLHCLAITDGISEAADFLRRNNLQDSSSGWNSARMLLFGQKHSLLKSDPGPKQLTCLFLSSDEALRLRLLSLAEKVLPNWFLLMRYLNSPIDQFKEELLSAYQFFSPEERELIRFSTDVFKGKNTLPADIFLAYEDETALDFCIKNGLRPSNSSQDALFYFLSGQWDKYYAADSDYRRIRIAYEQNDPNLQRRLINISRESGNNAWLRHINGYQEQISVDGSLSSQRLLIKSMIEQKQWSRLWTILPTVPLICIPEILNALDAAEFKPQHPEDSAFLADLNTKCRAIQNQSSIPVYQRYCDSGSTALHICSSENRFAVTFADRRILVWDKKDPAGEPIRISSNRLAFRKAILSHDGKYLCTDCGSDGITIFSLPSGQSIKTINTKNETITGMFLQPDDRRLILFFQSGKGTVLSFPGGAELSDFDAGLRDCTQCAYDPELNHICGITLNGDCTLFDVNRLHPVTTLNTGFHILASSELFHGGKLSFVGEDNKIYQINLLSGKFVHNGLNSGENKIRRIISLKQGELFLLGTIDGKICFFDPNGNDCLEVLGFSGKGSVSGLCFDEKNALLIGCSSSGKVTGWDLDLFLNTVRVLPALHLPGYNRLDAFCKKYPEEGIKAWADLLKTVIAWRRRFDIEVDFEE